MMIYSNSATLASQNQMRNTMAQGIVKPNNPDSPRGNGAGPVYEGNVRKPVAETSMEWRRKLEEMDAKTKVEDDEMKKKKLIARQELQVGLNSQLADSVQQKKEQEAEKAKERQAAQRARRRFLQDVEEEKAKKEMKKVEMQHFNQEAIHAHKVSDEESARNRKREGRRRRESLAKHVEDDEKEARRKKVESQRATDLVRRQELLEQVEEKKAREKATKVEDVYLAQQIALNDVHWAELEAQRRAKRKKAAEAIEFKQQQAAKHILQETLQTRSNLIQDRVENPRDPFTGEVPPMSPRTKRETHNGYRSELDRQVDLRRQLMAEEESIEKQKTAKPAATTIMGTSRLW